MRPIYYFDTWATIWHGIVCWYMDFPCFYQFMFVAIIKLFCTDMKVKTKTKTSFYAKIFCTVYNVFIIFFLPMKTWKNGLKSCPIQPKSLFLFHKNLPLLYNDFGANHRKFWEIVRNQLTISCQIVANISK